MAAKTFIVPNISCGHCTRTIETELGEIPGVTRAKAEATSKQVTEKSGTQARDRRKIAKIANQSTIVD